MTNDSNTNIICDANTICNTIFSTQEETIIYYGMLFYKFMTSIVGQVSYRLSLAYNTTLTA